jgi:hypothetical protein
MKKAMATNTVITILIGLAVAGLVLFAAGDAFASQAKFTNNLECQRADYDGDGTPNKDDLCPCDSGLDGKPSQYYRIKTSSTTSELAFVKELEDPSRISLGTYNKITSFLKNPSLGQNLESDNFKSSLLVLGVDTAWSNKEGVFCRNGNGPNDTCLPSDFDSDVLIETDDGSLAYECPTPYDNRRSNDIDEEDTCSYKVGKWCSDL